MKRRERILYLLPACILIVAFFIFPLCYLIYVSFFEWNGLGPMVYVGWENFKAVFTDPEFAIAVKNTIVWMCAALIVHIPFGLLLALMLNRKPNSGLYRAFTEDGRKGRGYESTV